MKQEAIWFSVACALAVAGLQLSAGAPQKQAAASKKQVAATAPDSGTKQAPMDLPAGARPRYRVVPLHGATDADVRAALAAGTTIPMWSYSTTSSRDGMVYSGSMVGTSPFTSPDTSTTVQTEIIPLILTIGGKAFDPTAPDPCIASPLTNSTDLALLQQSPIFGNHAYTMNGVSVGTTQYEDAFQRANFWSLVNGHNYHVLLSPATLPAIAVSVPAADGSLTTAGSCGGTNNVGEIEVNWFAGYLENTLIPSLAGQGVNPTNLPLFFLPNVVMYDTTTANCCILGFHSSYGALASVQTYSVAHFDTSGAFGLASEDTDTLAHEIGEWINDPLGNNATPAWGGLGQVSGCQANLEVGDPLSGTNFPDTVMPNGYTYHLQELAFYSWFFGAPSTGAGGFYSGNETFAAPAQPCPPAPPPNDNFANRIAVTGSGSVLTTGGSNVLATAETGEPSDLIAPGSGTPSVWWTWTAPCSFSVSSPTSFIDTIGSDFDTVLGVFTGSTLGTLTRFASDDDSGNGMLGGTSRVPSPTPGPSTLNIIAGTAYQIRVRGFGNTDTGSIILHVNQSLACLVAPLFTTQPSSRLVRVGSSVQFTVAASGTPAPTYQWQVSTDGGSTWSNLSNAAPYSGTTTTTLTITGASLGLSGTQYRAIATNTVGAVTSNAAALAVGALATSGDFDGDGKADITVFRPSSGTWFELLSRTNYMSGTSFQWGNGLDKPVPGDYDGDGKIDIAVFRPSNGTWYIVYSSTGSAVGYQWGNGNDVPVPGDYDGDGRTDIAVFRPSNGTWYVLLSRTNYTSGISLPWGNGLDIPVTGDYDGDGKADIAVFRPSNGTWYIVYSSTGTAVGVQWGNGNDKPVPGDYDGDGKTDIAVFRPSTGIWYIVYSSTGTAVAVQWGNGNDVPVPGDYDGDGKTDIAVFRPSTGTWYIVYSSTGTAVGVQWGNSNDVPILKRP